LNMKGLSFVSQPDLLPLYLFSMLTLFRLLMPIP
jgi:hypothetical protein